MSEEVIKISKCPICQSDEFKLFLKTRDHSITLETFDLFQCKSCQFVFTQNMPDPNHIGPYYESSDYISHSNTKKGLINQLYHVGRNWMLDYKLKLVKNAQEGRRLLDVGAGTGYFIHHMKSNGYQVNGVEIDAKAREFAKNQFQLEISTSEQLFEETGEVDIISLWHVLKHLHDLDAFIKKFKSILSKQGSLIIAVPNRNSKDARHYTEYWAGYDVPRHLWHFTPKNLTQLVEKHGFELFSMKYLPLDPFYNAMLSEKYKGSKLGILQAFMWGFLSWFSGILNRKKASSPVYIFKHKT